LYIILLLVLFLLSCQERTRNNIFDPQSGIDSVNLSLRITESDSLIRLNWAVPRNIDFKGFNLYRKKEGESSFTLRTRLQPFIHAFCDTVKAFDVAYSYYLTLIGSDGQSPPSKQVSTMPGPGTFWVLDSWNFVIWHLTYDLQNLIGAKYTIWIPQALALSRQDSLALITYPAYHYFELFNYRTSQSIAGSDVLKHPFDCVYDPFAAGFWLSDSSGGLYFYDPQTKQIVQKTLFPQKPLQIAVDSDQLFILDAKRKALLVFDKKGSTIRAVTTVDSIRFNNPYFIELDRRNHLIYLLDHSVQGDFLYCLNTALTQARFLFSGNKLDMVRADHRNGILWLAKHDKNNAEILQLSDLLPRLIDLKGFKYISDFKISPYTNNLIIADPGQGKVFHYRSNGILIGVSEQALYPFKVYNE